VRETLIPSRVQPFGQRPASTGKNILAASAVGCAERLMEPVFAGPSVAPEISRRITASGTSDPLTVPAAAEFRQAPPDSNLLYLVNPGFHAFNERL
jgi:hypothetical protein